MEITQLCELQEQGIGIETEFRVDFEADSCRFYYNDGSTIEANVPFLLEKTWNVSSSLLLWRKPEANEDLNSQIPFLFSWDHALQEIKWVPLSLPTKEFIKFNDSILNVQDIGRIFISTRDESCLYLWEYKELFGPRRVLDRNYSIHRSSPVYGLKESISNALGDTRSKMGMELLMSLQNVENVKKVFVSSFKEQIIFWVLSNQELKGYKVLSKELFISESCVDAALVKATGQDNDVLILKKGGDLVLWNRNYGINSVFLPRDFYFSLPRKRSLEESSLEKKAKIVELHELFKDSVKIVFSDGNSYKAKLDFSCKSSLLKRILDGIQGQLEISKESAIIKRFQNFHFSNQYKTFKEEDEFGNFVISFFSFVDLKNLQNAGKSFKKISDIQGKIPTSVISALKISKSASRFQNLLSISQSLQRELKSRLILQVDDLKVLLVSFHLIYESLKLNILLHKYLVEMGEFLYGMASAIGAYKYLEYYRFDGVQLDLFRMENQPNIQPFSVFKWAYYVLKDGILLEVDDFKISKTCVRELDNTISFFRAFFQSGPQKVVLEMVKRNFTLTNLDALPSGVSLFLQESLYSCKADPPADWPVEAYILIEREDLAKLFSKTQMKGLTNSIEKDEESHSESFYKSSLQEVPKIIPKSIDDLDLKDHIVSNLRFNIDNRLQRLLVYLTASKPLVYEFEVVPGSSDNEINSLQQQNLKWLSNRTLSLSFGRGLVMFQTKIAISTEKIIIPSIFLSAKLPPLNSLVEFDISNSDSNFKEWPEFHNGVASGLSIRENNPIIDSSWIGFNQILPSDDSGISSNSKHAGFLLGLGLNGYLKTLNAMDVYSYLISKDSIISVGLTLGLATSYIGSKDPSIMKLLSIHIQGLLPQNAAPLNISIMTQSVSLLSLGWVFEGSMNRTLAECSLKELLTAGKDEMYTLSCGITLGLIILGNVSSGAGLSDMQITTKLLKVIHNNDFSTALHGCTAALGLIYLKTHQKALAEKLFVPQTVHQLDRIPPDLIVLRILSRNLIMWDDIRPSKEWVTRALPPFLRFLEDERSFKEEMIASMQAYEAIVAGCCYSIALRFAGSCNKGAFETIHYYYKLFDELTVTGVTYACRLMNAQHKAFMDCLVIAMSIVMAGSGNLTIFSVLEERYASINSTTTYGNHLVTNMAMGLLFIGGGEYTIGTSNRAIAAMICAFYPKFPSSSDDNRFHIQAFRHLWVVAIDKRCLLTQDVESGGICPIPITVTVQDDLSPHGVTKLDLVTPCLLPELRYISHINFNSPRYWPFLLDMENIIHKNLVTNRRIIPIKKRAGHLSYIDDPEGIKGIVAMSFPRKGHDERSVRIRDSFIRCLSANSQFESFAKHFAYPSLVSDSDFDKFGTFCMNTLYDSLANDRPRIMRVYLWIHHILQDIVSLKNQDLWNLKIIGAMYLGDSIWQEDVLKFKPCLIQPDFLEHVDIKIYEYFEELDEKNPRFGKCLKHLIMNDQFDESTDTCILAQAKIFMYYFDWPLSFKEIRATFSNNLESNIVERAQKIRTDIQNIPFRTILQIASKI